MEQKTFSILNEYGTDTLEFHGTRLGFTDGVVIIYDIREGSEYIKAFHNLAPGTTICYTEVVK